MIKYKSSDPVEWNDETDVAWNANASGAWWRGREESRMERVNSVAPLNRLELRDVLAGARRASRRAAHEIYEDQKKMLQIFSLFELGT